MGDKLTFRGNNSRAADYFRACGIDTSGETIRRLSGGFFHRVYKVTRLDGSNEVRKISRHPSVRRRKAEDRNIHMLKEYFGDFFHDSAIVYKSEADPHFFTSSDFLIGRPVRNSDVVGKDNITLSPLGEELSQIFLANEKMKRETGLVFDMLGIKQAINACTFPRFRRTHVTLDNIFVTQGSDGNQHLKIIDTDLADLHEHSVPGKTELASSLVKLQEQILQKHFPGVYQKAFGGH